MSDMQIPTDHEHVQIKPGRRTGLPVMIAVHSTLLGPAVGGLRIKPYDNVVDGLTDCLRLSHAMTYQAAAIDNGTGGGKSVVPLPAGTTLTKALKESILLDVADHIHGFDGSYIAWPAVGTRCEDMDIMFRRTPWVSGRSKAAGGAAGTAFGIFAGLDSAIKTAIDVSLGKTNLEGLRFSIVGLGSIGALLASTLKEYGAQLILSDMDSSKKALAKELGAQWLSPEEAMLAECDLLAPCAPGDVLTADLVSKLRCKIICGAANHQLANDSVATALLERRIDYVPDFIANAGGLMYVVGVEVHRRTDTGATIHTREAISRNVRTILTESNVNAISTLAAAARLGQERLNAAAGGFPRQAGLGI